MPVCPSCGRDLPADAGYCSYCGATITAPPPGAGPPAPAGSWICAECGVENSATTRFCHGCGAFRTDSIEPTMIAARPPAAGPAAVTVPAWSEEAASATTAPAWAPPAGPVAPPRSGGVPAGWVPAPPPAAAPPAGRSRTRLLVVVCALIAAVVLGGAVAILLLRDRSAPPGTTGGTTVSPTPTPTPTSSPVSPSPSPSITAESDLTAYLQATEGLIIQAGQGRDGIAKATTGYGDDTMSSARAGALIRNVIGNRENVLQQLKRLSVPSSVEARQSHDAFIEAMKYSIAADRHYLDWVSGSGSESAAGPDNEQAGYWKSRFVQVYDRLAARNGLRHDWRVEDI